MGGVVLRAYWAFFLIFWAAAASAQVAPAPAPPPSSSGPVAEIVRDHIDLEINADGSFAESREVAFHILTEQGRAALQQFRFSYTEGFQSIDVHEAYTLKANGTRIDVPPGGMLHGSGVGGNTPGFEDMRTTTVVFPNLEVGDQIVLVTLYRQTVPWFAGQFAQAFPLTRLLAARDTQIAVTAPAQTPLFFDAVSVEGGAPETVGGKTRRTWTYHNDVALHPEAEAVSELDDGPQLAVSTFPDFATVARTYNTFFTDKAAVTPEIQQLADQLTAGVSDRREQARLLYEWVSTHISYVNIVLGAGGYIPHPASAVLQNRYGDCKDHVMILGALLAAKGIPSSPVLINAGNTYRLSPVASPFLFDHLISYIPEFKLYLDSTARIAPFGVLPYADSGKPVVQTVAGVQTQTPVPAAADSKLRATVNVTLAADGSATGDSRIEASGLAAVEMRGIMGAIPANDDVAFLRLTMGPGVDGTLDRGDTTKLSPSYVFGAHYRDANLANFPGPGALPAGMGFKPFTFTGAIAGNLPASRMRPYACASLTAEENTTIVLPPGIQILSLPKSGKYTAPDMMLTIDYENAGHGTIHEALKLTIEHPRAVCTADYYNRSRADFTRMVSALRAQILYK